MDIPSAAMNIRICSLQQIQENEHIYCPGCRSSHCWVHGAYTRKGFHVRDRMITIPIDVPRYRCLNPECPRCTFSVLPPQLLRYSRFFWPCLLAVKMSLDQGLTPYHVARHIWKVGRGVVVRAAVLLTCLEQWIGTIYREVTNGEPYRELEHMVKVATGKIGRIELVDRCYRYRYPRRC
jgi:hypothetical protein